MRTERYETPGTDENFGLARDGRESAFGAAYEHDIRDTEQRDQLYNCNSLRSLLSPARVVYIKVSLEALSIEKRY